MKILAQYKLRGLNIDDALIVSAPTDEGDLRDMYKFRYKNYLAHGYIFENANQEDIDEYDSYASTVYINVISRKQSRLLGTVRIIVSQPLPILHDCFDFDEPKSIKLFSRGAVLEVGRLIIERYSVDAYLPRHLVLFLLSLEIVNFARRKKIYFGYAFVKLKFAKKMENIFFPFFRIKNYKLKYDKGVLRKYFRQNYDPVIPVYFNYFLLRFYLNLVYWLKFRKYLDVIS